MKTASKSTSPFFKFVFSLALLLLIGGTAHAQYSEPFSTPSKGYKINFIDDLTAVNWSLSAWSTGAGERDASDYFNTTASGKLECIDLDQEVYWESPLINTTAANPVSIKMDLTWAEFDTDVAANDCSTDYIKVEYSVNGGAYVMIPNVAGGNACATVAYPFQNPGSQFSGSVSINHGGVAGGSTLKIRIKVKTNANAELVTIDNVSVPQAGVTIGCAAPVLSTVVTQVGCSNANSGAIDLSVSAGTLPYTYDWSTDGPENPDNDPQDLSGLAVGTYTVTVTDAASCSATASVSVTNAPAIALTTQVLGTNCGGSMDGEIGLDVSGGVPGYTYDWSNDGPENPDNDPQDLIGVGSGTYTATITDASGCTGTTSATVGTLPANAYLEQFNLANKGYLANYVDDFSAVNWSMSSWAPQPPASFGRDNDDYFRTSGGVLVGEDFDQDICWTSPLISRNTATQFSVDLSWVGFDNEDYINVKYSIDGGGYITIPNVVGGGAGTIQYPFPTLDQNGSSTVTKTGLSGSTIQIQVCGNFNSESMTMDNVSIPGSTTYCPAPTISLTPTNVSCNGGNNGNIQVTATGSTPPYNVSWSGPSSGNPAGTEIAASGSSYNVANLTAGTYIVTVTDAAALTATASVTVTEPLALVLSTVGTNVTCNGGTNGAIDLTVSGGTPGYTYDWSNDGPETPDNDTQDLTGLGAGTYTVTVTDTKGCTATKSLTLTSPPAGNLLFVNDDASGANDGSSWTNAFTNLQSALALANLCSNYTQIWVAAGTYKPTTGSDRTISFVMKNNLAIYGGFVGNEPSNYNLSLRNFAANTSTLSGDLLGNDGANFVNNGDNSTHVISNSGLNNTAVLDGFTITAANGISVQNGGGMINNNASPTVTNCIFSANTMSSAGNGGGGGGGMTNHNSSSPIVSNCTFFGNLVTGAYGGGMFNLESSPAVNNCSFTGNTTTGGGGAGIYNQSSSATVTNCTFSGNSGAFGGGMGIFGTNSVVTNCIFSGNSAVTHGGGGIFIQNSSAAIINCTFSGNTATSNGGAVRLWSSSNSPTFKNCILWGDSGPEVFIDAGSTFTINNSIVQGGCPAGATCTSVLNQDPVFVSQPPVGLGTSGNLRLTACSPALDAGFDAANATPTDLAGNARKFEAIAGGQMIDMGAYEFQSPAFSGNILYVNDDAIGVNNGSSWTNAFTSLQSALASTCPGVTQIWVAAGTYKPTTGADRTISFVMKNNLVIYGGFVGNEPSNYDLNLRNFAANTSTLSGDIGGAGNGDNSYHVISNSGLNNTAVLDGFTVTGGNANGGGANSNGGGMDNSSSSPRVTNCTFSGNSANTQGGGMHQSGGSPIITNCRFSGNTATLLGGGILMNGGSSAIFTNCTFSGNSSGGVFGGGGALFIDGGNATLKNCIIWNNQANGATNTTNASIGTLNNPALNITYCLIQNFNLGGTNLDGTGVNGANANYPSFVTPVSPSSAPTSAGNLHLQQCSPAEDAGTATGAPATDYDGDARPFRNGIDIGFDEYIGIPCCTFTLPANGVATVACPSQANVQPTPPAVTLNSCNQPVTMTGPVISATPACEGTKTYTWTYSDGITTTQWVYTYTITRLDFTLPANGASTVACPANATQPIPPIVADNCGLLLSPTGPVIGATPACEGTKTYTWTYTDCAGHSHPWVYTYTITRLDFSVPANGAATVACSSAITIPTPPTVTSNCGETITPTGPSISATPACEGTKTYTWTYTDCAGHTHPWSFVYTITRLDFSVPANGAATVACSSAITTPVPPVVQSNCGETITPTGPTISATPACEGTKTYTWTYTDCAGHTHPWSFVYTITRLDFAVPANGAATVACPALATQPVPPVVLSNCGETITPTGPTVTATPACNGTKTYTWTYMDCAGHTHPWSFVYTITRLDFTVPANGAATVACPALATQPVPPVVTSNCGETITPTGPTVTATPACNGPKTYTWTYTDCANHSHTWSFVYTITRLDFSVPANGASTVACAALATQPTPPTVTSNCGETITPTGPVIVNNPNPILCGGTRTYTWTYVDCAAHSHTWSFVYTINPVPFSVPAIDAATVACPALAVQPTPPVVNDACGNPTTPTGPVITNNPNPITCEGTRTYTWTYTDCAGNMTPWSFVYTIIRNDFTVPANGAATVNCPSAISTPVPPVVLSNCGETLTPTGPTVTATPACEGTKTYTWTYTDCAGHSHPWSFVYTITRLDFTINTPNGAATVNCPSAITAPVPPAVLSNCGETITPTGPVIVNNPNPLSCQGTRTYTWTYTDCANHSHTWSFVYTVVRLDFVVPANGAATVACPSLATQPTPPVVQSNCGEAITPTGPVITNNPNPLTCEGTRTYTWTYTDCANHSHTWSFVYTVIRLDFAVPANGAATVACPALATQPTPPTVLSNCGETITPTGPVITNNPNPLSCEGTRTYTWTYTDCAAHSHTWSFVYTVVRLDFAVPANGAAAVACPALATQPTPPTVLSNCGETITPTGPVIVNNPNPLTCEGTRTYTWTYTDCAAHSHTWSFVYTIERNDFAFPANPAPVTVACPALATQPVPPVVNSDCGEPIVPVGPTINNLPNPLTCEGTRSYAWTYTDCEGNSHTWTFTYIVERNDFTVPANGAATVACPSLATQPTPPTVQSNCGEVLTPTGPVIVNNPNPLTCEGTRTYTWTYTDCEGNTHPWSFVYTIERLPFGVPANGGATVACPDQTDAQPTPPVVTSNCGEVLIPVITSTAKPGCEGNRNWDFVYTDCEGNTATWTFIYTVEYQDFNIPASESYNVECPISAVQPTPPVVHDNCGKLLNPIGPTITSTNTGGGCESSRQYAWKYIDCEGNAHVWSVTYHFQYTADFFVYPDQVDYVGCLDFAQPPVPPTIYDNCGQEVAVAGPILTEEISEEGCSGVRTFTFVYTDCGGHSHPWSFTYIADDNEPPVGSCPGSDVVDETNLSCIEEVPCPTDYNFTTKIHQLLAAGHFYDLCSADLVVTLDSWSALWECSDPDGNGQYSFGRTFYFSIADQCGNEFPDLCSVTYSGICQPIVTFPQSTWGLEDETNNIDLGTIQHLLDAYGPLKVGGSARSLTLTQAQCVASLLPGQGGPDQLADCHQLNCVGCNPVGPNGMKNLLAANAIALQLSLRYSVEYNGANMAAMLAQGLGCLQLDPNIVTCNPACKLHIFDQQGVEHLYPYTLGGLVDLVSYYLGGNVNLTDGQSGVYGTALNNALNSVTNQWSGQPSPTGCDPNPGVQQQDNNASKALPTAGQKPSTGFSLAPNPANREVAFKLAEMPESHEVTLTIYNQLGQMVLRQDFGKVVYVNERIDLSSIGSGMYIVSVKAGAVHYEQKLVVGKN